jgi:hypothetical protein
VDDGEYEISVFGVDKAGNSVINDIMFTVDRTIVDKPKITKQIEFNPVLMLAIVGIIIAIIIGIIFARRKHKLVINQ